MPVKKIGLVNGKIILLATIEPAKRAYKMIIAIISFSPSFLAFFFILYQSIDTIEGFRLF